MKFYDELCSSELEQHEIPRGAWIPVYLKEVEEPDPPIKIVLELLKVRTFLTEHVLWAKPSDFVRYIESYGEPAALVIFVDGRDYFFSYMTPPGRYLFGDSETNLIFLGEDLIIGHHQNSWAVDLAISDFMKLGFSNVRLKLGKDNYV